jgi:hypothetical protein
MQRLHHTEIRLMLMGRSTQGVADTPRQNLAYPLLRRLVPDILALCQYALVLFGTGPGRSLTDVGAWVQWCAPELTGLTGG